MWRPNPNYVEVDFVKVSLRTSRRPRGGGLDSDEKSADKKSRRTKTADNKVRIKQVADKTKSG